jgi:glycosyltransferase involved in cell wall biosynthesis
VLKLLHLVPAFGPGGPTRSLLILTRLAKLSHPSIRHTAISLQPGEYMPLTFELRRQGATVLQAPAIDVIKAQIGEADVVLLHFWSTPRLWRLLVSDLPDARYMLWLAVLGNHPPHLLNADLLAGVQAWAFTAPPPAHLVDRMEQAPVIPGFVDRQRVADLQPEPHEGFNLDYIGTTNRGKMHPRFIEMMARLDIPDARIRICGGALEPAMAAALARLPSAQRFECRGFVEDIASVLETSDVFAYPLAERTYASSDISLQEAMLAGVPPVVLPHGGPSSFVVDGRNGIVARSEDEFVAAIEHLHRHPEMRIALGREARRSAERLFSPERNAARLMEIVQSMARLTKVPLIAPDAIPRDRPPTAAALFLLSQGWDGIAAESAVTAWLAGETAPLQAFVHGLDDHAFQVEGGVLHWRKEAMDDPLLRAWAALWLMRQGRAVEAQQEIAAAARLGAPPDALRSCVPVMA